MANVLVTIWWLFFWTAVGLCAGSFLNVVIFRLPRNRSLRSPIWSACPACRHRILWHDNIPVLSYMFLRGRCRHCSVPISPRYPIVEMAAALVVLLLLDAFMIGHVRAGLRDTPLGLTETLYYDWPILLAHIVLFACLLAMSAIDLEHYWVDIRFTNVVTLVGFAAHTLWTPGHSKSWPRPLDTTGVVCILALVGLVIVWLVMVCQPGEEESDDAFVQTAPGVGEDVQSLPASAPPSLRASSRGGAWIAGVLLFLLLIMLFVDETQGMALKHAGRGLIMLAFFFVLIVSESLVSRPADQAIIEAIDEERHEARGMALTELGLLLPAALLALLGWWIMRSSPDIAARVARAFHTPIEVSGISWLRHWTPLYGFATAASGFIIAGALGWAVRIVFTLVLGKEAFGAGDIHMMAAAGCVAGWPVVLLGFVLTCALALLGWAVTLPFKRTRAVPLGPWLSLSFLAVVIYYDTLIRLPFLARTIDMFHWMFLENSQPARRIFLP